MRKYLISPLWSVVVASLALAIGGALAARAEGHPRERSQAIVIHLGHATDDIHSADMALHMGANLAKHGANITMFLDREGVRIADTRLPIDTLTWGENNVGEDYEAFVAAGGKTVVCPGCAQNQALTAEFLRKGASMGTPDSVAELLLAADKVIDF
jgi:sulfur relay (sulfurtransferase) complex TusBCD TusD component (DsrE family)